MPRDLPPTPGADPFAALAAAVKANDAGQVGRVLTRHPELRPRLDDPLPDDNFGATPLLSAVYHGNREMVDRLLAAGADINARSHWWAGGFGVLDHQGGLAAYLIARGAFVDAHAAARLAMLDRLVELVSANPDVVHARGGDGETPLHFAADVEIARYLLDHGAEIDARDIDHESTPAQHMLRGREEVARFLVARGCRTDLLMAAALGDAELVRKHLDADPGSIRTTVSERHFPKQNPRSGGTIYIWTLGAHRTAHLIARERGHEEVFRLLMARTPAGLALALACELGDQALMERLLAGQRNLGAELTDDERRRLADAAQDNNLEAVRLLLKAGWPVDARGQHGATALHWAAWQGNTAMVREILRYRPPVDAHSHEHPGSPLGWALYGSVHGWHPEAGDYAGTVEALLQAGAAPPEPGNDLIASDAVRAVLERRPEPPP